MREGGERLRRPLFAVLNPALQSTLCAPSPKAAPTAPSSQPSQFLGITATNPSFSFQVRSLAFVEQKDSGWKYKPFFPQPSVEPGSRSF